eukprot:CAMPEP_0113666566 /NCGR_PEP_ID=MMETSP0038_2-20120614/2949_1 /TAXON_ID=2898 /ORGANISM="Cryptomonas paramecium" /LENGTH=168 /DNA_ID=CAMNT_0000582079 /DNA_START=135 /DNA_END=638 /DNA_ORIENTATION=+ /assembly_acc=CAM_ASM_000170
MTLVWRLYERPWLLFTCLLSISLAAKQRSWLGPNNMISGTSPSARAMASFARANDELYLFGGFDAADRNDMYKFDASTLTWTTLTNVVGGRIPDARDSYGIGGYKGKLFLFGGYFGPGGNNDLWVLDIASLTWNDITFTVRGRPPPPLHGHGFALCNNLFFSFGGYDN